MSNRLRSFIKRLLRLSFVASLMGAFLLVIAVTMSPKPDLYASYTFSSAIYDRNNQLMRLALAHDDRYRLFVPLDDLSSHAIAATLQYEDYYFYQHIGVNPLAIVRAAWVTYVSKQRTMGASTITMQLARMRFAINSRSVKGKLKQVYRALQIERHYHKDQILEAYLNLAPYGGNIEGLGAAALVYFNKPASRLSFAEATALAVIPQNPAKRKPTTSAGYEQMISARQRLVTLWEQHNIIDSDVKSLLSLPLAVQSTQQLPFDAPHYSQALLEMSRRTAQSSTSKTPAGSSILSTLDTTLQTQLEQQIEHYVTRRTSAGINNASALLVNYQTMEVVASVGSADFSNNEIQGQVDGTRAKRSPGSTLKPFVYGLAMDKGLIHPMSMMKDAPKRFGAYTPENFDRGFMGPIFAKDALIYSRNVPAIALLNDVGHTDFHRFLNDAHVANLKDADHYGLAMILGGNEVTMHELAGLYAMLANGGTWQPLLTQQPPLDSNTQPANTLSANKQQLLSEEASFLVLDMLRDNPRPDGLSVDSATHSAAIAWKTGTSYAYRDAWTVGVFGPYVLAVWVGNFDGSGNSALVGQTAAAPLFFSMADRIIATQTIKHVLPSPTLNLKRVAVCANTGDLPNKHCPSQRDTWFIPGVSPIKVSNIYREVAVNGATGKRTCRSSEIRTIKKVFEFWPSDIDRLFQQAGISVRRPPPWDDDCDLNYQASQGAVPQITSPISSLRYQVRPDHYEQDTLPLTATTDADVSSLYWFVNDQFVAIVDRDEPLLWSASPGAYDFLVVDDHGRSSSHQITIDRAR